MLRNIHKGFFLLQRSSIIRCLSDKIMDFPDMGPTIPDYPERPDEAIEIRRSRLLYQSRKRGMLENGLLLSNFAAKYLKSFNEQQLSEFDVLINKPTNDWDLYYWILGKVDTPDEYDTSVMSLLKEYCQNKEMEIRNQQPDLD